MKTFLSYTLIFATIFSFVIAGCSNHSYQGKTVTSGSAFPRAIERAKKDKRYFIMQSGVNIYSITSVDLDNAKQQMTVTLDKVDSSHLVNLKNPEVRRSRATEGETATQSEIHLLMKDSTSYTLDEPHTIALNKVARIELTD